MAKPRIYILPQISTNLLVKQTSQQYNSRYIYDRLLIWIYSSDMEWIWPTSEGAKASQRKEQASPRGGPNHPRGEKDKPSQLRKWAQRGTSQTAGSLTSEMICFTGSGVRQASRARVQHLAKGICEEFSLCRKEKVCAAWEVLRERLHLG